MKKSKNRLLLLHGRGIRKDQGRDNIIEVAGNSWEGMEKGTEEIGDREGRGVIGEEERSN